MSESQLWRKYGIIREKIFFFHSSPFSPSWRGQEGSVLKKYLIEKAKVLCPEFVEPINRVSLSEQLARANQKMVAEATLKGLKEWSEKSNQVLLNCYHSYFEENPYFAEMLLKTEELELVYANSLLGEEELWSIKAEFGRNAMYDRSLWLKGGNQVGEVLCKIREELKKKKV